MLNLATENTDNPDLRDRGYIYWRLLSTDPEAAQQVVLADKPTISDDTFQIDASILDLLVSFLFSFFVFSLSLLDVCACVLMERGNPCR